MNRTSRIAILLAGSFLNIVYVHSAPLDISQTVVILGAKLDSTTQTYNETVFITTLSLDAPRPLYAFPSNEFSLNSAISPDGHSVVVASREGPSNIVHVRRILVSDGRVLSDATLDPEADEIGFTPDAKWATYLYPSGTNWDVYMAPVAGGPARRLTFVGNVAPLTPAVIADGQLYYCGLAGQIRSEELFTHRHPRVYQAMSYRFTVAPSGDTLIYETADAATGAPEIDTIDTHNGFHDRFPLDDPASLTTINLAVSQDERFVYFTNRHHGAHGTGTDRAERLNLITGRFVYPATGIDLPEYFTTTGVNPNH